MTNTQLREKLIENGVRNCVRFGFHECDTDNILTDVVYAGFFESMLKDNMGIYPQVDEVAKELLTEIQLVTP